MCTSDDAPRPGARYNYPDQRWRKTFGLGGDGKEKEGVAGTTTLIADLQLAGVRLTPVSVQSIECCREPPANAPWTCRIEAPGAWQMCRLPVLKSCGLRCAVLLRKWADQPITGFDWHADKQGLFCCGAFDQTVRVGTVTRLNRY